MPGKQSSSAGTGRKTSCGPRQVTVARLAEQHADFLVATERRLREHAPVWYGETQLLYTLCRAMIVASWASLAPETYGCLARSLAREADEQAQQAQEWRQ